MRKRIHILKLPQLQLARSFFISLWRFTRSRRRGRCRHLARSRDVEGVLARGSVADEKFFGREKGEVFVLVGVEKRKSRRRTEGWL
jgi:hypothetical protein